MIVTTAKRRGNFFIRQINYNEIYLKIFRKNKVRKFFSVKNQNFPAILYLQGGTMLVSSILTVVREGFPNRMPYCRAGANSL